MNRFVSLWSRKRILKRGRLTSCLVLIALVMAPLVTALIFSDSMMEGITSKYIYLSDGHVQIGAPFAGTDISDFDPNDYPGMIYSVDEVTSGYALMYSATETSSVMLKGVGEGYFNELRMDQISFEHSTVEATTAIKGIAISRATAKALDVGLGDRVALMIVPDDPDKVLRPVIMRIDSIFHSGYDQLDELLAFVDLDYAKTLYSSQASTNLEVLVTSEYMEKLDPLVELIEETEHGLDVTTWNQHNVSVYENFITSKQMIFIILLLVVVVAAFYTASVAQQMIQDDISDIAIVKLIGSSDSLVKRSAFISVYTVTVVGMLIGIVLGIIIGLNLGPILTALSNMGIQSLSFYLLDFDITIPWLSILVISACLLLISYLSIQVSLMKTRRITPIRLFTSL